METKICSICKEELPLNLDYFYSQKNRKSSFYPYCKKCSSEKGKRYREDNKEKLGIKQKQYRDEHKREAKEYRDQYYENNKEKILQKNKEYADKNPDKIKGHKLKYSTKNIEVVRQRASDYYYNNLEHSLKVRKDYRINNKEKIREIDKKYKSLNKEHIQIFQKEYRENNKDRLSKYYINYYYENKEKCMEIVRKRRGAKNNLPSTLTTQQWNEIKEKFNNKCAYCGKEKPLAQEHFIALSKDGEYTVNNIIPSCRNCNSSKSAKDFFEWYPNYVYYSEKRERVILDFLGYKKGIQQLKLSI